MRRSFWVLWFSQVVNRFGDGFYYIALSWLVYDLTGSALALGGLFFVYMAVTALVQVVGGPLTDRLDRRRLLFALDLLRGVLTAAPFLLWRAGLLQAWHVYAVFIGNGILGTPYSPVSGALLPRLVDREALPRANAWLRGAMDAMYLVGPAAAGLFIARFGAPQSLLVDAGSFWISSLLIGFLRVPGDTLQEPQVLPWSHTPAPAEEEVAPADAEPAPAEAEGYWSALRSGWRVLASDRLLGALTVVTATLYLSDTVFLVLVIPYVRLVLHGDAAAAGVLEASLSGGTVLAAFLAARKYWDGHSLLVWATAPLFCLATGVLAFAPNLVSAVALQVVAGLAVGIFNIRAQALFQQTVDNQRLGGTLALRDALGTATQSIGSAIAGGVAAALGVAFTFGTFGLAGAAIGAAVIWHTQVASPAASNRAG